VGCPGPDGDTKAAVPAGGYGVVRQITALREVLNPLAVVVALAHRVLIHGYPGDDGTDDGVERFPCG
jgi:hypothetical protein